MPGKEAPKKTGKRGPRPVAAKAKPKKADKPKPEKKPEPAKKPAPKPRQARLPGTEDAKIERLEGLADVYVEKRDARIVTQKQELQAKDDLRKEMQRLKRQMYKRDGYIIERTVEKEGLKVRVRKPGDDMEVDTEQTSESPDQEGALDFNDEPEEEPDEVIPDEE